MNSAHRVLQAVRTFLERRSGIGESLLVAVSGGPDSVALLRALAELRQDCRLRLCAAHVHHGWRGAAADADAEWVVQLGQSLDVSTTVLAITPEMRSAQTGRSLEEGARNSRYELLAHHAAAQCCLCVAVGHTADDQVETVLHHILRGTGLAGLAGMPVERSLTESVRLIRPLLEVARADVLAFLAARNQEYRTDATNADLDLTRNRLRAELLPRLRGQFNSQVDGALRRLSQQAAESVAVLDELADQLLAQALLEDAERVCRLDAAQLSQHPEPLVRQTLRRLWIRRNWPRQEMGQREWERLARLAFERGAIDFPGGVSARHDSGPLVLTVRS